MGAANFDDTIPGGGFALQCLHQLMHSWQQRLALLPLGSQMDGTGEHIVGALAAVDVVIGMHHLPRAASLAGQFAGPIGNHLIDVHVRLGAAAALPARQRKFPIQRSGFHLAGCLADPLAALLIQHAELMVGLGGHALEASDRMD